MKQNNLKNSILNSRITKKVNQLLTGIMKLRFG